MSDNLNFSVIVSTNIKQYFMIQKKKLKDLQGDIDEAYRYFDDAIDFLLDGRQSLHKVKKSLSDLLSDISEGGQRGLPTEANQSK